MKYKIVDKKAPRFRRTKYQTKLVVDQLWKEFCEESGSDMPKEAFRAMYNNTMDTIIEFATTDRNGVVLPEQMGNIHLSLFKMKRRMYDFISGMNTGQANVHNKFSTDNLQGKICWDYKLLKYKPRDYRLYGFGGSREFKTRASHAFLDHPERFRKNIYMYDKKVEKTKRKRLERNERNNQGSPQPVEGTEQGS